MHPEPCEVQGSPAPHVVHGRNAECACLPVGRDSGTEKAIQGGEINERF
jgi:hypothetical protein